MLIYLFTNKIVQKLRIRNYDRLQLLLEPHVNKLIQIYIILSVYKLFEKNCKGIH